MLELARIASDEDFGFFELAGWTPSGLDALLASHALPCPVRPGTSATANGCRVLRVTPRVAWLLAEPGGAPAWTAGEDGVVVDLCSSRLRIRLRGPTGGLLARLVAVDLSMLGADGFAATTLHGVPVIVLPHGDGFDLLVPRTFSASLLAWIEDAAGAYPAGS